MNLISCEKDFSTGNMIEKNGVNQESGSPETIRDEDNRLLPLTPPAQIWPNNIINNTYFDTSPTSPGTYYTTIHSTSSRRYKEKTELSKIP